MPQPAEEHSSSIEFALRSPSFINGFAVVEKESRKREREERGLFIERGRKPECAADKELAKSEGEREVEFLIRAKWGRCGRKGEREREVCFGAVFLSKG